VGEIQDVDILGDDDVVRVRQAVRALAVSAGLSLVDQTKMVTAASELARNTQTYGGGGSARLELVVEPARSGVRATFTDTGPGIPDVDVAMADGYTSGSGLGLGLSGARRLVDAFEIDSEVGRGTTVVITKWSR